MKQQLIVLLYLFSQVILLDKVLQVQAKKLVIRVLTLSNFKLQILLLVMD